jgi:hypothetical protein
MFSGKITKSNIFSAEKGRLKKISRAVDVFFELLSEIQNPH